MTNDAGRTASLDNLRTLMVLLVLVFHSGASYGSAVDFWPFHDAHPSRAIDLFMFILDVFMMAILFFIAGYFALPSLRKKGFWPFVGGKLRRLGLPWLLVTILLLPVLDYLHYWSNAAESGLPVRGYGEHWLLSMRRIADFHTGWMRMSAYTDMTEHFYQRYMWYVSLLVLFFVVFALLYLAAKALNRRSEGPVRTTPAGKPVAFPLALTGLVTVLLFALLKLFLYADFLDKGWFSLGNVIQFQCGKLAIYGSYFALGVYACSRRWFTGGNVLGKPWKWGVACALLFCATMYVLIRLNGKAEDLLGLRLAFVVCYPLWTLSFLGMFLSCAAAHWNRSTRISRDLADNSYGMYLAHYAIPMAFPLFLSRCAELAVPAKFGLVALVTVGVSYGVSRYLIRPFPGAIVIGLIALSIVLSVAT